MNILILGAYESNNLGDAVICECVSHMMQKYFPHSHITIQDLLPRDRSKPPKPADFKSIKKRAYKNRIRYIFSKYTPFDLVYDQQQDRLQWQAMYLEELYLPDYDFVIFAGGQMFMDTYALFLHDCVLHFQKKGTPVFFHACGTGPSYSPKIRQLLAETLSAPNVHSISCRDDVAAVQKLLKNTDKTVLDTYDSALSSAKVYKCHKDPSSDTIGLGIMYSSSLNEKKVLAFWQSIIRQLDTQQKKWKLFTNGAVSDDAFARKLLDSMPEYKGQEDTYLISRDREPEGLVHTISRFSGLISFRLHSHIIAASLDIPSVAIVWDQKLPLFFQKIGHPERCFRIIDPTEQVLQELQQAMLSGYDRTLLEDQIYLSEQQLIKAINELPIKGGTT